MMTDFLRKNKAVQRLYGGWCLGLVLWLSIGSVVPSPLEKPHLRENLPAETLAYIRLPQIWNLLGTPKGSALAPVLEDPHYQQQLYQLQTAVERQLLPELAPHLGTLPIVLLRYLRSPLEIAFLYPAGTTVFLPNIVLTGKIALTSVAAVNQWLLEIKAKVPQMEILQPLDVGGSGVALIQQQPVFIHYQTATQALFLMAGRTASQALFNQFLAQLQQPAAPHRMLSLEQSIDSSQQGLFIWIDMEKLAPVLAIALPLEQAKLLNTLGVLRARALAFGWGVSEGKGRLKCLLDAPALLSLPSLWHWSVENQSSLAMASAPDWVGIMGMPLDKMLPIWEQALIHFEPQQITQYLQFKQRLEDVTGLPLHELAALLSGEIVYFADENGDFIAVRVREMARFNQLLAALVERFHLPYRTLERQGVVYHHLAINYGGDLLGTLGISAASTSASTPALSVGEILFNRLHSHFYWVQEGDYWVFSTVPQALIDRQAMLQGRKAPVLTLKNWLAQQGQRSDHTLLLASVKTRHLPRAAYYLHLEILEALSDLAGAQLDLFAMPSARQLHLAEIGNYGVQFDWDPPRVGLELVFEHNPLELFGVTTVIAGGALLGIGAAMAIPAYQFYQQ